MGIVMKAALRSRFTKLFPGVVWEWFIIDNPFLKYRALSSDGDDEEEAKEMGFGARQVTKKEALAYVQDNGLVLAYETKDGAIYDTPRGDFRDKYHLDTKDKVRKIEQIWD